MLIVAAVVAVFDVVVEAVEAIVDEVGVVRDSRVLFQILAAGSVFPGPQAPRFWTEDFHNKARVSPKPLGSCKVFWLASRIAVGGSSGSQHCDCLIWRIFLTLNCELFPQFLDCSLHC